MTQLAANLSMLFNEHPFLDRFDAAASAGFRGVEFLFPYEHPPEAVAERLRAAGLTQALFNLPPGDFAAGERGMAALPGREAQFREGLAEAIVYANALGCTQLHAMAGLVPAGGNHEAMRRVYINNLRFASELLADEGIDLLIEPINARDIPGYFLSTTAQAKSIIEELGAPNLKLQFDVYHCQISEGDITRRFEALLPLIGHVQIAGNPDRHEPHLGEVNYEHVLKRIDALGYQGWVGCEYRPKAGTVEGLSAWAQPYGVGITPAAKV
jgi:hydroxypyruvate isomerase